MIKKFINNNKHIIKCSREVLEAIHKKIPLVALESSIVSHGMPYPQSFEMVKEIEEIVPAPATSSEEYHPVIARYKLLNCV